MPRKRGALDRLELLIDLAEMRAKPRTLRRYIASVIHVIVQVQRMASGTAYVGCRGCGCEGVTYVLARF